mgnify:CR=1 FL=1
MNKKLREAGVNLAVILGAMSFVGGAIYVIDSCTRAREEGKVYKSSKYYKEVESFKQELIRKGKYNVPEIKEAVDTYERGARKTAVLEKSFEEAQKIYDSIDTKVK